MEQLTGKAVSMIGMVHVGALPGTPRSKEPPRVLAERAAEEALVLAAAGFDAILLENMHDLPYLKRHVGPEIVAGMTAALLEVRRAVSVPLGLQILAGANKEAIAVAHATGARFIRAEGFVFAHVADEGIMESDAAELMRYRRAIGAEEVLVYTDIKKKHSSHAITADVGLAETAEAAQFFGADGLIITGSATGKPTSSDDLRACAEGSALPRLVGSGTTPENLPALWMLANGFIVGSWYKQNGRWDQPVDADRARRLIEVAEELRAKD